MKRILSFVLSLIMLTTFFAGNGLTSFAADKYQNNDLSRACVHDPSIVKGDDGRYYAFGSHIAYATSDDVVNWTQGSSTMDGDGTKSLLSYGGKDWKENCAKALEWTTITQKSAMNRSDEELEYNCWAADVIYNKTMGKWCMYACCSVFGTTFSVIFLATSDTVDGKYKFEDTMIYSGFTSYNKVEESPKRDYNFRQTNIISAIGKEYDIQIRNSTTGYFTPFMDYNCSLGAYPNCIDPTAFTDKNGSMWLVYGSFSGGIFVVPLVEETGLVDYSYLKSHRSDGYDVYFGKQISKTNSATEGTGEGPYIVYDRKSDYYYFYLTYGGLSGNDGYNIREYRSKNPDGPYVDKAGYKATDMKNTGVKLMGNYGFSCNNTKYLSGGHSSSLVDDDDKVYQMYHTRFTCDNGWGHQIRTHQMLRTSDGWMVMLPYEYQGETVSSNGYQTSEIVGTYEFINHKNMTNRLATGADISTIILPTQKIELAGDGTIYCLKDYACTITNAHTSSKSVSGKWSRTDGKYYASFTINGVTYNGAFCKQRDESAEGKWVMTFAALGTNNEEIWGVQTNNHMPNLKATVTPATASKTGTIVKKCAVCNMSTTSQIDPIKTIALSATSYTYDGKVKKPTVTVKDSKGKTIAASNYTVSYANGRKNVGKYAVKITFKGNYSGTKTLYFTINPKNTSISGITAGSKKIIVKLKKYTTQTTGYQIQYATNAKFTSAKTVTVSNKTTSKTIGKLVGKKKYYVRVRTYKTVGSAKYYSAWGKAKTVTTKK